MSADASNAPEALRLWRFGDISLDERTRELRVRGKAVHLHRKPMDVLLHLLQHAGEVVSKEELAATCWPRRVLSDTVLTTTVNRLRAALGDTDQTLIRTVHGFGYRLSAAVTAELFIEPPPPRLTLQAGGHPPLRPNWRLLERLGAGGSGEVWLAEHEKTLERRVFKFAVAGDALRALKREITLYRLMKDSLGERPEVVRILDWNLELPPFFIESEFVPAGSLIRWSQSAGGLAALPLPLRIELIAQCADALAAAHGIGVLHKDLKPSNVLVQVRPDGAPAIKLTDFGSGGVLNAERLARMGITRLGFTMTRALTEATSGTPLYLPPEVLSGQPATVQGDVYALGVMLYQAAVGDWNKPLAPGWERNVDDEILRQDIAAAADGDPSRRLADAAELARRLRSIDARRIEQETRRRASAEQRALQEHLARSEVKRRYLRVTVAALVLGFVCAAGLSFKLLITQHQREAALQQAREERAAAEQVTQYLVSLFDAASPDRTGGKPIEARALVERGQAEAMSRFAAQPRMRLRMLGAVGSLYCKLGDPEKCSEDLEQAIALLHDFPDEDRLLSAQLYFWHGKALLAQARFPDAERELERAQSLYQGGVAPNDARLADTFEAMGAALRGDHKTHESIAVLERARHQLQLSDGSDPPAAAGVLGELAISYQDADRVDDAGKLARHTVDLIRARSGPDSLEYLQSLHHYGEVMGDSDRDVEGANAFAEVVAGYSKIYGPESQQTLAAEVDYAVCLMAVGHFSAAEVAARRALDGFRKLDGTDSENYASATARVGRILFYRGEYEQSLPYLREAYRVARAQHAENAIETLSAGFDLARPLIYLHHAAEAQRLLAPDIPPDQGSGFAKYMRAMRVRWLGESELESGQYALATKSFDAAAADFSTFKAPDTAAIVKLQESQGWLLYQEKKYDDAAKMLRSVLTQYQRLYPADSAYTQAASVELAAALIPLGQTAEARSLLDGATTVVNSELAPGSRVRRLLSQISHL